jgi:hypothetical protein
MQALGFHRNRGVTRVGVCYAGDAHAGGCFANAAIPAFKANSHFLPLFNRALAIDLGLYSLIIFSALASCSSCSLASIAPPPLTTLVHSRTCCRHVELDMVQRVS